MRDAPVRSLTDTLTLTSRTARSPAQTRIFDRRTKKETQKIHKNPKMSKKSEDVVDSWEEIDEDGVSKPV
jgi:hypothetical protein